MSRVIYNGKRLIPAPLVSLNKNYQSLEDGTKIGSSWSITLNGTIVHHKGSPNSHGVWWTASGYPPDESLTEDQALGAITNKIEAISQLFSHQNEGATLEIQTEDSAYPPFQCNPKITSLSFTEGQWVNLCPYTITMEADIVYVNGVALGEDGFTDYIESASENWSIETSDEYETDSSPTFRLTHTVQAKGKRIYLDDATVPLQAWERARDYVLPKLGYDISFTSGAVPTLPSYYGGYNHVRSQSVDKYAGNFSVTENWLLASGNALETFDVNVTTSLDTALTHVAIQGTVTGLEQRNSSMGIIKTKYENASTKFSSVSSSIFSRAQTYASTTLNITPLQTTIGKNPKTGVITYNYEYDTRPSNLIPGARSETITVTDTDPADVVAAVFVIGRQDGPVLQDLGAKTERKRVVNIEAVMPVSGVISLQSSVDVSAIVDSVRPTGYFVKTEEKNRSWDAHTGRFTYTEGWIWEA